jgi:hypothetical protein
LQEKLKKFEEENLNFKQKLEEIVGLQSQNFKLSQELVYAKSHFEEVKYNIYILNSNNV